MPATRCFSWVLECLHSQSKHDPTVTEASHQCLTTANRIECFMPEPITTRRARADPPKLADKTRQNQHAPLAYQASRLGTFRIVVSSDTCLYTVNGSIVTMSSSLMYSKSLLRLPNVFPAFSDSRSCFCVTVSSCTWHAGASSVPSCSVLPGAVHFAAWMLVATTRL